MITFSYNVHFSIPKQTRYFVLTGTISNRLALKRIKENGKLFEYHIALLSLLGLDLIKRAGFNQNPGLDLIKR